jgi:catechol 2,3-dioxygenase
MEHRSISPDAQVGKVSLTVGDLPGALAFYTDVLGLSQMRVDGNSALLAAAGGEPLLELVEQPGARPRPARSTGLYHFAILVPDRWNLACVLRALVNADWPLQGASDHGVSEALYLADPDGNGIEVYRDRPREEWPRRHGQLQMATDPLDLQGVLSELDRRTAPWEGMPPATRMGHVHLHVADLQQAHGFYVDLLGFDVMQRYGASALFVSAGGYHHHIGLNTWAGIGAPPPPAGSAGLRYFTVAMPDDDTPAELAQRVTAAGVSVQEQADGWYLQDGSGNGIRLAAAGHAVG